MNNWEVEIRMKFPGHWPRKMKLIFEWKAFLIGYDLFDVDPEEFLKLDQNTQTAALIYGAAYWGRIKEGKKIFFSYEDTIIAIGRMTTNDMNAIAEAMQNAHMPKWMAPDKKKTKGSH